MSRLYDIQQRVQVRTGEIAAGHTDWPCRKGCDDCCRRLASPPRISRAEWQLIAEALDALSPAVAGAARDRITVSTSAERPVTCPLLDSASATCLVYEARPVACRAYGFYVERQYVLGCERIQAVSDAMPDVIWGNHVALEAEMSGLGAQAGLAEWLINSANSMTLTGGKGRTGAREGLKRNPTIRR